MYSIIKSFATLQTLQSSVQSGSSQCTVALLKTLAMLPSISIHVNESEGGIVVGANEEQGIGFYEDGRLEPTVSESFKVHSSSFPTSMALWFGENKNQTSECTVMESNGETGTNQDIDATVTDENVMETQRFGGSSTSVREQVILFILNFVNVIYCFPHDCELTKANLISF